MIDLPVVDPDLVSSWQLPCTGINHPPAGQRDSAAGDAEFLRFLSTVLFQDFPQEDAFACVQG